MPVGLPKVPYPIPIPDDDEESECNGLYRRRILILGGEINSDLANIMTGALIFFSLADSSKKFKFFINSLGGSVIDGIAIYDTIQTILAPVETIVTGMAASMACFILNGGTSRIAFPNARVMMHQPSSPYLDEKYVDIFVELDEIQKMHDIIIDGFRKTTLKSRTKIMADMNRDLSMSAIEAQEYGLVDLIGGENIFKFP
uniref:ATP-dependent Clp protease proteolytic subunit n=2 Tax=Adenocalymma TaxID=353917 RepID=A0A2P1GGU6_9LAMI|nr:clp protease proteolytic subunit [Adenocalymma peregrinum]ATY48399.1 clp protease proteolytic subunit [Adenocalymma peregrinum]AVM84180.1 clp protease proteolytic subunit [Adenocalymma pubescens]